MPSERRPLRRVVEAHLRPASSINQSFKYLFWELDLECGHVEERRCRYEPGGERGFGRLHHGRSFDEMLPPPKRARCSACGPREAS